MTDNMFAEIRVAMDTMPGSEQAPIRNSYTLGSNQSSNWNHHITDGDSTDDKRKSLGLSSMFKKAKTMKSILSRCDCVSISHVIIH